MATITKGKTFTNGELVTPATIHQLVDAATISGIVNADISASAAIVDTKLAQISTANKVAQSAVTNLTTDLAGKAASSHTHDDRYYTETEIDNKLSGLPVSGHTHTIANVTGLQTALDGKQASGSYAAASHTHGNITNTGAIGTTSGVPVITGTNGVLQAGAFGTTAGTFCQGNDARLSNLGATSSNVSNTIVQRNATSGFEARDILLRSAPTNYTSIGLYPSVSNDMQGFALIEISHVNKTNDPFLNFVFNGNIIGSIKSNSSSSVSYNTTSDYRLKTNIEPLTAAVSRLLQIPVHRFNWLADPTSPKVDGFLAHEAQAIVPESVTGHKDEVDAEGKPIHQGIDQSKLVPLLVAAVQELAARVAALEAR